MEKTSEDDDRPLRSPDPSELDAIPQPTSFGLAPPRPVWAIVARFVLPSVSMLALLLVLWSERDELDYDLHLIAPPSAHPGDRVAVRALLYGSLRAMDGPKLVAHELAIELVAASGEVLSRTTARPARGPSSDLEAMLAVPAHARGQARIVARARVKDHELSASAALSLERDAPRLAFQGRPLRELQRFAQGPVRAEPGARAPSSLRARVMGGACVPEEICTVLVHVGEPAAALWIEPNSTVTPARTSEPPLETSGVVRLELVTHGPEAELWLRATRGGELVARRSLRLPVALGSAALRLTPAIVRAPSLPRLSLLGGDGGCIIDVFHEGRWLRTGSLPSCTAPHEPPFPALPPGLHRFQARRDPFSADHAAVAVAYVRSEEEDDARVRDALIDAALARDPSDAFAASLRADSSLEADPLALTYLLAILEDELVAQPSAVTGYHQSFAALRASQRRLRVLAVSALACAGMALAFSLGRRGLSASSRASRILIAAGQDSAQSARARLRSRLVVLASAAGLLCVFVLLSLYVMARGIR